MTSLRDIPVVFIDLQTTGSGPDSGRILELAYARGDGAVTSHVLRGDQPVPRRYLGFTGLTQEEVDLGRAEPEVLAELLAVAGSGFAVAHYARFEAAFLAGKVPYQWLCTHAIARRLYPDLPSRSLRALAGYLGHGLELAKRSAPHVVATREVWAKLCAALEQRGVTTIEALNAWLELPVEKPQRRRYLMDRAKRLALPPVPGIYRMVAADGRTLYIGKATSLKDRVNSYFRQQRGHSAAKRELLAQVADILVTPCHTALEAALLESDEIKKYDPPYNTALRVHKRQVVFLNRAFEAGGRETQGPYASLEPFRWLAALAAALGTGAAEPLARIFHDEIDRGVLQDGLGLFLAGLPDRVWSVRSLLALGLVTLRQEAAASDEEDAGDGDEEEEDEPLDVPELAEEAPLTPAEVAERLGDFVRETARYHLRSKIIGRLASGAVAWKEPGAATWRRLMLAGGRVVDRGDVADPLAEPPPASREAPLWDVATYDRVRVLATELNREEAAGKAVVTGLGNALRPS